MNLDDVAHGLSVNLESVPGMNVLDYVPAKVSVPCAFVAMGEGNYNDDLTGNMSATFSILVLVSKTNVRGAQAAIRAAVSPTGVKSVSAAIESDSTLGGSCDSIDCRGWKAPEQIEMGGQEYVGVEFEVEVIG